MFVVNRTLKYYGVENPIVIWLSAAVFVVNRAGATSPKDTTLFPRRPLCLEI